MNTTTNRVTVLLIKDVPDLPEDFNEVDASSEWCSNKSALLFPMSIMTSYIWKLVIDIYIDFSDLKHPSLGVQYD